MQTATHGECSTRLAAYLAGLPAGLASWPDHVAKASLLRAGLRTRPIDPRAITGAPPRLRALVETPPLDSSWITEVEYCALSLLIADVHGLDGPAFGRFWYEVMTSLVNSKLYSLL